MVTGYRLRKRWRRLGSKELGILACLLVVAGGALGFAEIAEEVLEGDTRVVDEAVLIALRNPGDLSDPLGPVWLERAAGDLTSLGSIPILVLMSLAVTGFLIIVRKRGAAFLVLVAVGGGLALSTALKLVFERTRRDLVPHAVEVSTASFPSGHSMLSAVTCLTLGALLMRVQPHRSARLYLLSVAVTLTIIVGVTRVYLGVHWPTDVLAGWCVGAAWAMLCWLAALWLQTRGQVEWAGESDT